MRSPLGTLIGPGGSVVVSLEELRDVWNTHMLPEACYVRWSRTAERENHADERDTVEEEPVDFLELQVGSTVDDHGGVSLPEPAPATGVPNE